MRLAPGKRQPVRAPTGGSRRGRCQRGHDISILEARRALYEQARKAHPARWSGRTRAWSRPDTVWLNPEKSTEAMGTTARAPYAGEGGPMAGRDAA